MNNRKEIPTRSLKNIGNYKRYMLLIIVFPPSYYLFLYLNMYPYHLGIKRTKQQSKEQCYWVHLFYAISINV